MIHHFLYNIFFVPVMRILLPVLSLFMPKLKKREQEWREIFNSAEIERDASTKLIWFHAASMGEFEQAKYIIEQIKSRYNNIKVLVTFFSPSGYDNQKDYPFADAVIYLPNDTPGDVKRFLNKFEPDLCVFIRYEIWHNFLFQCSKRKIPAILIAATKPSKSKLASLELVNQFYAMNYSFFNKIFTVSDEHTRFFESLYINSEIITATDPRFDRIHAVVEKNRENELLPKDIFGDELILVAGSTWPSDEEIIIDALKKINSSKFTYRCIFVPHEPTEEHVHNLQSDVDSILFSELEAILNGNSPDKVKELIRGKHIIIDSIGKLLSLYALADVAYIGGAFGAGVHSVTEPAGYGLPLASGPKMKNSPDAVALKKNGALTIVNNSNDVRKWLVDMTDDEQRSHTGSIAREYIISNLGTSDKIINDITSLLFTLR